VAGPIVVLMAGADLVADGLVASLARPGGNLTGSQVLQGDLIAKRLELLEVLVPSLSRGAFLQESVTTSVLPQLRVRMLFPSELRPPRSRDSMAAGGGR
jgi:putative ABC transport system substrate-binding protein